jgi:hypothetical protein
MTFDETELSGQARPRGRHWGWARNPIWDIIAITEL